MQVQDGRYVLYINLIILKKKLWQLLKFLTYITDELRQLNVPLHHNIDGSCVPKILVFYSLNFHSFQMYCDLNKTR